MYSFELIMEGFVSHSIRIWNVKSIPAGSYYDAIDRDWDLNFFAYPYKSMPTMMQQIHFDHGMAAARQSCVVVEFLPIPYPRRLT